MKAEYYNTAGALRDILCPMRWTLALLLPAVAACAELPSLPDSFTEADAEEQRMNPAAARELIDQREKDGNLDRALRVLEYHAAKNPQSGEIRILAAEAYSRSVEALQDRKAQEKDRLKRLLTKGKPHADAAVRLEPKSGAAHYWRACLLLHEADFEQSLAKANEALKELDQAEALQPDVDNGGPSRMKGKVLAEMPALFGGSLSKAVASFLKSLRIAPDFITTHLWLGEAYIDAKKPDLARKELEWVLAAKPRPGHEKEDGADKKRAEEKLKSLK